MRSDVPRLRSGLRDAHEVHYERRQRLHAERLGVEVRTLHFTHHPNQGKMEVHAHRAQRSRI